MEEKPKVVKEEKIQVCPLLQTLERSCVRENCAWYLQDEKKCAITRLALSMRGIANNDLRKISDELASLEMSFEGLLEKE
jgi:hypothetical protein